MTRPRWQPGPAQPRLDPATVDVWLVALDGAHDDGPLDARERDRAARFVRDEDARRWRAARATLRRLLAAYADADPRELRFDEGPHGKPRLAGERRLRFNLSHSGDVALIAVAWDHDVGVDVELPRRTVDHAAIARRVLTAAEADRVASIEDPGERERAFLQAWVRWEAVLKCRGTGIGGAAARPAAPDPWVTDLNVPPPAAAALAVANGPAAVRSWRWPPVER
ncbi:MAG TPA: 4'-phosphopantetheinyl transferase superfamily protein [Conexibacter sp.]